jgi:hypothetical protein
MAEVKNQAFAALAAGQEEQASFVEDDAEQLGAWE